METCKFILIRGPRKGQLCGNYTKKFFNENSDQLEKYICKKHFGFLKRQKNIDIAVKKYVSEVIKEKIPEEIIPENIREVPEYSGEIIPEVIEEKIPEEIIPENIQELPEVIEEKIPEIIEEKVIKEDSSSSDSEINILSIESPKDNTKMDYPKDSTFLETLKNELNKEKISLNPKQNETDIFSILSILEKKLLTRRL